DVHCARALKDVWDDFCQIIAGRRIRVKSPTPDCALRAGGAELARTRLPAVWGTRRAGAAVPRLLHAPARAARVLPAVRPARARRNGVRKLPRRPSALRRDDGSVALRISL